MFLLLNYKRFDLIWSLHTGDKVGPERPPYTVNCNLV